MQGEGFSRSPATAAGFRISVRTAASLPTRRIYSAHMLPFCLNGPHPQTGLSVTRAKVRTYATSKSSGHTFYVMDAKGGPPDK